MARKCLHLDAFRKSSPTSFMKRTTSVGFSDLFRKTAYNSKYSLKVKYCGIEESYEVGRTLFRIQ